MVCDAVSRTANQEQSHIFVSSVYKCMFVCSRDVNGIARFYFLRFVADGHFTFAFQDVINLFGLKMMMPPHGFANGQNFFCETAKLYVRCCSINQRADFRTMRRVKYFRVFTINYNHSFFYFLLLKCAVLSSSTIHLCPRSSVDGVRCNLAFKEVERKMYKYELCASCERLKSIIRDGSVNTLRISSTLCVARERRTWFTATTRITSHRTGARVSDFLINGSNRAPSIPPLGNISESIVLSAYLDAGFIVSIPFGSGASYDLIVDVENCLYKIQVKTAWTKKECIAYKSQRRKPGKGLTRRKYENGEVDYFAVYCPKTKTLYGVPAENHGVEGHLRLTPTKNGQSKNIKWALDYSWERHIEELKNKCARQDSNLRLPASETGTLSTELRAQ